MEPNDIHTARKRGFVRSEMFVMLCIYFGVLLIHCLMIIPTTIFNLTPDEYVVAAYSAYFNGLDWSSTVSQGGYYGYFLGLLYTPVFALIREPLARYHAMLAVNGIIMSFVPVIAYYLCRRAFDVKKSASVLFSLICGMYPCYMLLTKFTWNETMCDILIWVFLLLVYKAYNTQGGERSLKKQLFSVAAGLTLVAAYATHGRMLALLAAGIVLELVVLIAMRRRIFCFTGFFASIAASFAADSMIKKFFRSELWMLGDSNKMPINTIEKMLSRIADLAFETVDGASVFSGEKLAESIGRLAQTLVGHFFYFFSSTYGVGALCTVAVITAIVLYFRRRNQQKKDSAVEAYVDDNTMLLCLFTLLAMGAIFVVSVVFKGTSTLFSERSDTTIYGRYTEIFYPVAILAGLVLIYKQRVTLSQTLAAITAGAAVCVMTIFFVMPTVTGGDRFVSAMIVGIAPMRYGEGMRDAITSDSMYKIAFTMMILLFAIVMIWVIRRGRETWYITGASLGILLVYTSIYGMANYTIPQSKNAWAGAAYMQTAVDTVLSAGFDSVTVFDISKDRYIKAQFLYPELKITVTDNAAELTKLESRPEIILSERTNNLQLWLDGVYLVGDINSNINIYACTEEAARAFEEIGVEVCRESAVIYDADSIPATTSVGRYETAVLPNGASVYTNYFSTLRADRFYITVTGSNLLPDESCTLTLTSDKGTKSIPYEITQSSGDRLTIAFTLTQKTSDIRFKLTNNATQVAEVSALVIDRETDKPYAVLPAA
ncbi:MAG: hypothetical protein ACI4KM_12650 [Oscillospiraceae bacterium]